MNGKNNLLVKLYRNHLTSKKSYKAKVLLKGTLTNEAIAQRIVKQRSEYRYDTILGILNMSDEVKREALADGFAVNDRAYHAQPSLNGRFDAAGEYFDPGRHKAGITVVASPELHSLMGQSTVKNVGPAMVGPVINTVEDIGTQTVNRYLTPGRGIRILGRWLQLVGDHPSVGVYFVKEDDPSVRIGAVKADIVDNKPSQLLVLVPGHLPAGAFFVEVTTQYTKGKIPVKEPRSYRLNVSLEQRTAE